MRLGRRDVVVLDEYVGSGYRVPTTGMVEAVRIVAGLEGVMLDPVYTGKAMAGPVDLARRGEFGADGTVVFSHKGGLQDLFGGANMVGGILA